VPDNSFSQKTVNELTIFHFSFLSETLMMCFT